jgi:hypothetical protein
LHAPVFDEEGCAKIGPNLAEQGKTAGQQLRHFIRRRYDGQATGTHLVSFGNRMQARVL